MILNTEANTDRKLLKVGLPIKTLKMLIIKISLMFSRNLWVLINNKIKL